MVHDEALTGRPLSAELKPSFVSSHQFWDMKYFPGMKKRSFPGP